ncbi:MAG TPA: T9SS type A sorting domain-containing protein, partial [Saprospiraceae bacterium]|nr:T9SS type A sorting domain-containing protein [Saprospiraceae bacterium]
HNRYFYQQRSKPLRNDYITLPPPPEDSLVKPLPCAARLRLYPNPALHSTWLESPGCQPLQVQVYDVMGRHIEDLRLPADALRVPVDLLAYAGGMYLLRIRVADGSGQVLPLVVMRH